MPALLASLAEVGVGRIVSPCRRAKGDTPSNSLAVFMAACGAVGNLPLRLLRLRTKRQSRRQSARACIRRYVLTVLPWAPTDFATTRTVIIRLWSQNGKNVYDGGTVKPRAGRVSGE